MARLDINDDQLGELVRQAVADLLKQEQSKVTVARDTFLEQARSAQRSALQDVENSITSFEARARTRLTDAETAISSFDTSLTEKKKKVEEALNVKVVAGFSALLLILALDATAYLSQQIITVGEKNRELAKAAADLKTSSAELQTAIDSAKAVYKTAFESKNVDPGSQLQTLQALTNRVDADCKRISGDLTKLTERLKPYWRKLERKD